MTRQGLWQKAQNKKGLCQACQSERYRGSVFCLDHLRYQRNFRHRRYGTKPWKPGSRGRRPLELSIDKDKPVG